MLMGYLFNEMFIALKTSRQPYCNLITLVPGPKPPLPVTLLKDCFGQSSYFQKSYFKNTITNNERKRALLERNNIIFHVSESEKNQHYTNERQ